MTERLVQPQSLHSWCAALRASAAVLDAPARAAPRGGGGGDGAGAGAAEGAAALVAAAAAVRTSRGCEGAPAGVVRGPGQLPQRGRVKALMRQRHSRLRTYQHGLENSLDVCCACLMPS
jgi:hypothetical protein